MNPYPCCDQPTGEPLTNGYVDPEWNVSRHICFNAWWTCPKCGEETVVDLWDKSTWTCPDCPS